MEHRSFQRKALKLKKMLKKLKDNGEYGLLIDEGKGLHHMLGDSLNKDAGLIR